MSVFVINNNLSMSDYMFCFVLFFSQQKIPYILALPIPSLEQSLRAIREAVLGVYILSKSAE